MKLYNIFDKTFYSGFTKYDEIITELTFFGGGVSTKCHSYFFAFIDFEI